ncbi:hypothetical protein HU200_032910 [Digitaria exilis]|uniref:Cytochrome P450 n=1 Tax=Digitaria exilis TaxID=1010633 RepID=A0A835BW89_9POAL|nr:hypothetical protein HU200_032910 [Digitaria exilis]
MTSQVNGERSPPGMDSPLSQPTLLALSLLLLLALYLARRRLTGGRKTRKYPPVAGTVLHQLLNFGRLVEYQTELSRRHRTFRMLTPTCNYIYTVEPANVEYILKSNFANYGKGSTLHGLAEDLLGDGIFVVDGDRWRHQRKVASHEFSTRVLREFSSAVFRDTAVELAGIVAAAAADGERLDITDLLMRSTLDSIFKVGFGVSLGSLSGCSEEGAAFARAFDDASEQVLYRLFDVFWKAKRLLNISSEAAMKRSLRTINDFIYAVIDRKIGQMGKDQQEFSLTHTVTFSLTGHEGGHLSRFLLEREQDPDCFDNKYLRDIILSFVTAGRDTTAGTLSWFLYVLCRNEAVQDRIVEEVRAATAAELVAGLHLTAAQRPTLRSCDPPTASHPSPDGSAPSLPTAAATLISPMTTPRSPHGAAPLSPDDGAPALHHGGIPTLLSTEISGHRLHSTRRICPFLRRAGQRAAEPSRGGRRGSLHSGRPAQPSVFRASAAQPSPQPSRPFFSFSLGRQRLLPRVAEPDSPSSPGRARLDLVPQIKLSPPQTLASSAAAIRVLELVVEVRVKVRISSRLFFCFLGARRRRMASPSWPSRHCRRGPLPRCQIGFPVVPASSQALNRRKPSFRFLNSGEVSGEAPPRSSRTGMGQR